MPSKKKAGPAFTVAFPKSLPVERDGDHWWMEVDGRRLRLSNLDKVFWPKEGYTKGDLLSYYYNVAELIVPYLAGRPLTMKRMPDGLGRCPTPSEESKGGVIDYLMIEDTAGLLFVVNLGCIEFHQLHAR